MKPTKQQAKMIHKYFNKVLGYGNKCDCTKQASIQNITGSLVEFYCRYCDKRWEFESKIKLDQMMSKVLNLN